MRDSPDISGIKKPLGGNQAASKHFATDAANIPQKPAPRKCRLCPADGVHRKVTTRQNAFFVCDVHALQVDLMPVAHLLALCAGIDAEAAR